MSRGVRRERRGGPADAGRPRAPAKSARGGAPSSAKATEGSALRSSEGAKEGARPGPVSKAPAARTAARGKRAATGREHVRTVTLTNRYGLHMRPAKRVVEVANTFPCDITLVAKRQDVDAKGILGIIGLGAECGDSVEIRTRGPRAEEAAKALADLLAALPELHQEPRDVSPPRNGDTLRA